MSIKTIGNYCDFNVLMNIVSQVIINWILSVPFAVVYNILFVYNWIPFIEWQTLWSVQFLPSRSVLRFSSMWVTFLTQCSCYNNAVSIWPLRRRGRAEHILHIQRLYSSTARWFHFIKYFKKTCSIRQQTTDFNRFREYSEYPLDN